MSHFLRDTAHALGFDDPDGKAAESGDIFWAVAGAYSASILIPVEDIGEVRRGDKNLPFWVRNISRLGLYQ